ncbi:MAG TPA: phosphotransferase [Chloroflexota bacterium]|nr:phosphotransferase [Chloroflexota bacterium]
MSALSPGELLSVATLPTYLRRRGLLGDGVPARVTALGGGVSNVVLAVAAGDQRMVVKQALPRLRVADEWLAKRERVITEAEALRTAARLTPGAVPAVLDVDAEACVIIIEHAPPGWQNWKDLLLAGTIHPAVAQRLGMVLGVWHGATSDDPEVAARFGDSEAFDQLRIDPYYRTVMRRHPELAPVMTAYLDRMLATHRCLVHGDFSPKNVLVGDDGLWVLDFEVAHMGDPVFDVAFMLNHLLLKAIHRPVDRQAYKQAARRFWDTYQHAVPAGLCPPVHYLLGHLACLMVARVDGKSPAEYLTPPEQRRAWALGTALLTNPPDQVMDAWQLLEETART